MAQGFYHQEHVEPKDSEPGFGEFVEAGTEQPQAGDDITALDGEHSLMTAANGTPLRQCLPRRMIE